ncbi:hypothetical protein [Promicromonospora aerolata]|uniref:Restriction endonuclease n=1 Tax=Promicromonospora aerolata TaxID=195749 RepID=A0ABW4VAU6_9MICO
MLSISEKVPRGTEQLSGYLLEEVVAHFLASSGYRLLQAADDGKVLKWKGHGLCVQGRGALHQADALGELKFTLPFTLPIRLFVEAKNTKNPIGLTVVRNAHGVLHDVNENSQVGWGDGSLIVRSKQVQYRYSLFSTGGFSREAQEFAYAHQISLIDLSGPSWGGLAKKLKRGAARLLGTPGLEPDVRKLSRLALRRALGELAQDGDLSVTGLPDAEWRELRSWAEELANAILRSDANEDLLLGFIDAPFVLALYPVDSGAFQTYVRRRSQPIKVNILYEGGMGRAGGEWVITNPGRRERFRLRFLLPGFLEEPLLAINDGEVRDGEASLKNALMSTIVVYIDGRPVRFEYERALVSDHGTVPEDAHQGSELREALGAGEYILYDALELGDSIDGIEPRNFWSEPTVRELIRRLNGRNPAVEKVFRYAAQHGGSISREEVYDVAGFAPDRRLIGLARPLNRIREELILEGSLYDGAAVPFRAHYEQGIAVSYEVSEDIRAVLRPGGSA